MLSQESQAHERGAEVTDENLINPEHPGWCSKMCGPGGMRGVGPCAAWHCQAARRGPAQREGRSWLTYLFLLPRAPSTCAIAVCRRRLVLVAGCASSPGGKSRERRTSASARCCI